MKYVNKIEEKIIDLSSVTRASAAETTLQNQTWAQSRKTNNPRVMKNSGQNCLTDAK